MVRDFQDAILAAQAEVTESIRDIAREILADQAQRQARMMWLQMPDEMKEKFKAERPEEYAAFMKGK